MPQSPLDDPLSAAWSAAAVSRGAQAALIDVQTGPVLPLSDLLFHSANVNQLLRLRPPAGFSTPFCRKDACRHCGWLRECRNFTRGDVVAMQQHARAGAIFRRMENSTCAVIGHLVPSDEVGFALNGSAFVIRTAAGRNYRNILRRLNVPGSPPTRLLSTVKGEGPIAGVVQVTRCGMGSPWVSACWKQLSRPLQRQLLLSPVAAARHPYLRFDAILGVQLARALCSRVTVHGSLLQPQLEVERHGPAQQEAALSGVQPSHAAAVEIPSMVVGERTQKMVTLAIATLHIYPRGGGPGSGCALRAWCERAAALVSLLRVHGRGDGLANAEIVLIGDADRSICPAAAWRVAPHEAHGFASALSAFAQRVTLPSIVGGLVENNGLALELRKSNSLTVKVLLAGLTRYEFVFYADLDTLPDGQALHHWQCAARLQAYASGWKESVSMLRQHSEVHVVGSADHSAPINTGLLLVRPSTRIYRQVLAAMHHSAFNLSTGYDGMGPPLRLARSALSLPEVKRLERTQFFARDSWRFDFSGADQGFFYYFFFLRNRYGGRPAARAKRGGFSCAHHQGVPKPWAVPNYRRCQPAHWLDALKNRTTMAPLPPACVALRESALLACPEHISATRRCPRQNSFDGWPVLY